MQPFLGNIPMGFKSPEQFQNEYTNLMNTYKNIYGQMNNLSNQANVPSISQNQNGGEFRYVESYTEVENTPTRLDGVPTLFVLFNKGLMWSKKYEKGQHTIQAYQFGPINSVGPEPEKETPVEEKPEEKSINTEVLLGKILSRLDKLEEKSNQKQVVEVDKYGLDTSNLFSKRNNES